MRTLITVNYLEMIDQGDLTKQTNTPYILMHAIEPSSAFSRFLYASVGAQCNWYMRRKWTPEQWKRHVSRGTIETWVGYISGTPCGYFELELHPDRSAEIALFGLLPQFIGRGIGRVLLRDALAAAWSSNPIRVWLHTCSLDHPQALPNYLAQGMRVYRTEQVWDDLPDSPLEPW